MGQRRGPAAPGEDNFTSPGEKSFHISTTPTTRGRKRRSSGPVPPRKVWKPEPIWLVADWLRLIEPVPDESCLSGQRRGPAAPGEDMVLFLDQKSFHISTTNFNHLGFENGNPPGRYCPARCGNPNHTGWLLIGWGSWSQRAARVASPAKAEVAPLTGRLMSHPRIRNLSISLQFQQTGNQDGDPTGRYRPTVWQPHLRVHHC